MLPRSWEGIAQRASKIKSHGKVVRFIKSNRDAKKLGDLIGEINESIQEKVVVRIANDDHRYLKLMLLQMQGILVMPSYHYPGSRHSYLPRISRATYTKSTWM